MTYRLTLPLALMASLIAPAQGSAQAGFDCAKATTSLEMMICASPQIAEEDRAQSIAFKALREAKDTAFRQAILEDQRSFLRARELAFDFTEGKRAEQAQIVTDLTAARAEFLAWVNTGNFPSPEGVWRNAFGEVKVTPAAKGWSLQIQTVDPAMARWLCDLSASGGAFQGGQSRLDSPSGAFIAQYDGRLLRLEDPPSDAHCGHNGRIGGTYFRIGAP